MDGEDRRKLHKPQVFEAENLSENEPGRPVRRGHSAKPWEAQAASEAQGGPVVGGAERAGDREEETGQPVEGGATTAGKVQRAHRAGAHGRGGALRHRRTQGRASRDQFPSAA